MNNIYTRTTMLLGEESIEKIKNSKIAVFGVGGVGGFCIEALGRCGVGKITLIDFDTVDETNINRQIIALRSSLGKKKIDVMKERLLDINKDIEVETIDSFIDENSKDIIDFSQYDYIVDCIDHVKGKLWIIKEAKEKDTKVISAMGMGNKIEPQLIQVADIKKTKICPLAKKMRRELKNIGIVDNVKTVFSIEEPRVRSTPPGSISFVPSVAGLIMAKEIIKDIVEV